MHDRPTVGSLFSGIGGIDLGLERAGFRVAWQSEIDPYCRAVLRKHWPDVPLYGDIRDIGDDVERVDMLAGGFPCQPVSLAGRRKAQDDERWLWPEFARLIRLLRPRFVLLENVPGLLARGMGDVLGDLAACGYDAEWDCIPAAAFGAPHRRDRVWIVAYADSERRAVLADPDGERRQGWAGEQRPERRGKLADGDWWAAEPDVGRVAYGVPARMDRIRALGNAVVPQVAEWIGRRILDAAA